MEAVSRRFKVIRLVGIYRPVLPQVERKASNSSFNSDDYKSGTKRTKVDNTGQLAGNQTQEVEAVVSVLQEDEEMINT